MSGRRGGRAAAAPIVDVYDVLLRSDKPMTVPQIAHALELRGKLSGYLSDALREYTATLPAAVQAEIPERPSADYCQEAWLWWVRQRVIYGRNMERFQVVSKGQVTHGVRVRESEYQANQENPPMVWQTTTVPRRRLVPYSLDERDALVDKHNAGMQYINDAAAWLEDKRHQHQDTRDLIELGLRAIRAQGPGPLAAPDR